MWAPCNNLQTFAISRPPLVVFTLCLSTFAIATLSLSYIMRKGPITDPDIILDWNKVMDHMSKWELCIATKQSLNHKPLTIGQPPTHQSHHQADFSQALIKDVGSFSAFSANNTVSISLRLKLRFEAQRLPKDVDVLWGNVSLVDLGLSASASNQSVLTVIDLGARHKLENCTTDGFCDVVPGACVTLHSQTSSLPNVKESKTCHWRKEKLDATFTVLNEAISCSGTMVLQQYIPDPSLMETLNYNEQTLMNLHLAYTSYFLFVMVVTVLCYAVIRGQVKPGVILLNDKASDV